VAGASAFIIQIGLFIAIFYFLLIRPQRRQAQQHKELLGSLQRGDQVVTRAASWARSSTSRTTRSRSAAAKRSS